MSGQKPLLQIEEIAQNFNWQFKFPITAKHHSFRQTSKFTQGAQGSEWHMQTGLEKPVQTTSWHAIERAVAEFVQTHTLH